MKGFLDSHEVAKSWLQQAGFKDTAAAHRNFVAIAERGVPLDLLESFRSGLEQYMPASADADRALNNFERMLGKVRSPLSIMTFLLRKPHSLAVLLQLFATSQYFSDLIVATPEYFDFLWERGHAALDPRMLHEEILGEIAALGDDEEGVLSLIRRHRHRELLRIGYRDIVLGEPLDRITESISDLADCLVEVALTVAYRKQAKKHGEPRSSTGALSRLVVLAMGKLGGRELNYSSDIDLILVYDYDGQTDGQQKIANADFFASVIRDLVRLLSANTPKGQAYRVDLRLRPHGNRSALCLSLQNTLAYYDQFGRTWERQALVKVRPIAGSMRLGDDFLKGIEPFVYRKYLSFVEINEIKAIKRRIESKTRDAGADSTDLKTGHGGIRDIEFVTQFLQLLNAGKLPELRERNTLRALKKLTASGCINQEEHTALETAYRFLRKAEHRLQFMFDLQTHRIPENPEELDRLALRLGYLSGDATSSGEQFLADLRRIAEKNRSILKHLMLELFPANSQAGDDAGEPETDLLLDPEPDTARIQEVLGRYRFQEVTGAYKNLTMLAREESPCLSSIRCRHFLASIAPKLLQEIAEAPDPDMALVNLEKVTASLGAKGALWESFRYHPAWLELYVNLCSWSQFLSEILINNPGMIDELLDTLVMNRPPSLPELGRDLRALLKGAREVDPILHSFKNTHLLQIGVHDILGKNTLRRTTRQLSDLAESVIGAVVDLEWQRMIRQYGTPMVGQKPATPSSFVLLALGKLGGREMSYHSDVDLVLVYDDDGKTVAGKTEPVRGTTNNHHFYTELARQIIGTLGRMGPLGRLYAVDVRLRPTGRSGSLVVPLDKFESYYIGATAALWEYMALTRARVVYGDRKLAKRVQKGLRKAVCSRQWRPEMVDEIHGMRKKLEASRGPADLKRGAGGIVDVEFAVQMLQLKHGSSHPEIVDPSIWKSLSRIRRSRLWSRERVRLFYKGYSFLRSVESRVRIVHNVARDVLPESHGDLLKLAYRLGYDGPDAGAKLQRDFQLQTGLVRKEYLACLDEERKNQ